MLNFTYRCRLYLITKLQNLKAIHNYSLRSPARSPVVSNYKITKSESYSQRRMWRRSPTCVVSNYKITKSESYSQLITCKTLFVSVVSNYKITKSESYSQRRALGQRSG